MSRARKGQQGMALVVAMAAVAILTTLLADMHEATSTSLAISTSQRDQLQAEYLAKSGLNLTRLLVAQEPTLRQLLAPIAQLLIGKAPPQIPVWKYADLVLQPFCDVKLAEQNLGSGFSFGTAQGIGDLPGTCEIAAIAENSRINLNDPLSLDGDPARANVAMQFFALSGGFRSPSPYDNFFQQRDADGLFSSRLDVVSALVDWWDVDAERTVFDPGSGKVRSAGAEDEPYANFRDRYRMKNAPFDSLEELRLVRGMGDDLWATLIDPDSDNLDARLVTIYGPGSLNPNEAPAELLLARLCAVVAQQPLCAQPLEGAKFKQLVSTARQIAPLPFFTKADDFLNFIEGKGGERDLYPLLRSFLGEKSPLLFAPLALPEQARKDLAKVFDPSATMLTIQSTGRVGRSQVRLRAVLNFDPRWIPPPPNAGRMSSLGIVQHYRID